MSQTVTS